MELANSEVVTATEPSYNESSDPNLSVSILDALSVAL